MPKTDAVAHLHGFEALKPLATQLKQRALALEKERKEREEQALVARLKRDAEAHLFQNEVQDVRPIKASHKAASTVPAPLPVPLQRLADEQDALRASLSDEIDIERLLETDEALSFRRPGLGIEVVRKLRRGEWSVQAQLDLHGFRTDEARLSLVSFLAEALTNDLRCLRIIHGKGLGSINKEPVLKGKVLKWLTQRDEVLAFCQARPNDGGSGALLVLLKGAAKVR